MKILILFLVSPVLFASTLNLSDVIKLSLNKNEKIKALKEKLNQFENSKKLAKSSFYPNLSLTLAGNYQKDALYTNSPKFNGDPYNYYNSDLKISQPLFYKGMFSAVSSAEMDEKIHEKNIEIEERALVQNVIESFYKFILNQEILENLKKNQEIIQKALATSNQRYNMGRGQMLDVLQVKTQLALIEPQIELAKSNVVIAGQQIVSYIGSNYADDLKLKGSLNSLALKDVQNVFETNKFYFPEYDKNQLQIEKNTFQKDMAIGKHFPSIKLVGDYYYSNYKKSDLYSDVSNSWAIQLQVTFPIFSGGSSFYERNSLVSEERELRKNREELEAGLELKQITALKTLEAAENSMKSTELAVKLSEQSMNEAARLYKLSQIDFLQYLTVQQAALLAKNNFLQFKYVNLIAYSNYFVSSGQNLEKLVDILVKGN